MKTVNLFYLAKPRFGGWVTFTAQLAKALRSVGLEVRLFQITMRTENVQRPYFAGEHYQNITHELALAIAEQEPCIITALEPKNEDCLKTGTALIERNALFVMHDTAELARHNLTLLTKAKIVVIRQQVALALKELGIASVYVKHPYTRIGNSKESRQYHVVATSRIDFDKHTEILIQANELLSPEQRIRIYGNENRIYTHHKLDSQYPKWRENYFGRFKDATKLVGASVYCVDMSLIKGDGGGTQYTFLEAFDMRTAVIVQREWLMGQELVEGVNVLAVDNFEELATILTRKEPPPKNILDQGEALLSQHSPTTIGDVYAELLSGG